MLLHDLPGKDPKEHPGDSLESGSEIYDVLKKAIATGHQVYIWLGSDQAKERLVRPIRLHENSFGTVLEVHYLGRNLRLAVSNIRKVKQVEDAPQESMAGEPRSDRYNPRVPSGVGIGRLLALPLFVIGSLVGVGGWITIMLDPQLNPPYDTGNGVTQVVGTILLATGGWLLSLGQKIWNRKS